MKKKIIYLSIILVLVISVITLSSIYKSKDNKYKKEYNTISKGMAIMIKEKGATDYVQSNSKDIPKGNYVLNEEKTYCENNGKVTNYNSTTGTVSLNFIGSDRCYLYFDYEVPPRIGYEAILLDNSSGATTVEEAKSQIESKPAPDFSTVTTASDKGMYSAPDDLGTSYYFRGAVDNNWVKYGKYTKDMYNCNHRTISATDTGNSCTKIASKGDDMYWRIIRINGDNSIRMIYSGVTPPTESTKVIKTTDTSLGTIEFNHNSNSTEYVVYMYEIGEQHGTSQSSDIKTYLDNWYANYTDLNSTGTKITDQIYCNDRTASTSDVAYSTTNYTTLTSWNSTGTEYYYGANGRIAKDNNPMLTCAVDSDRFTVNKINGKGNSALTYPIGLITADEVAMAGSNWSKGNTSYYLYTGDWYWAGSPCVFDGGYAIEFYVAEGDLSIGIVDNVYGVRGVVSLSSESKLLGSGTYNDVYTVVGEDDSTEDTSSGKSFDTVFAANDTDIFSENGIRYEGADPNNYICLDNKTSGACSSSSLLFRIIGLFDEEYSTNGTTSSGPKKLLKILDTNNFGGSTGKYWSGSSSNQTSNWSKSTLNTELNGTYLSTLFTISGVNSKLENSIVISKWHLGGANNTSGSNYYYQNLTTENYYKAERSPYATSGTLQNLNSGNPEYVFAKVGLMYPSDYGYASVGGTTTSKENCRAQALYNWDSSSYSDCKNNDWVYKSQSISWGSNKNEWLISPGASNSYFASDLNSAGYVNAYASVYSFQFAVRPTFYLDSSILKIVGGLGTKDNAYRIG